VLEAATTEVTPAAEASAAVGAPMPDRVRAEEQEATVPPEAPEATETPTADENPAVEETVVEAAPQGEATAGSEGAHSSPHPLELVTAPEVSVAPSPP
jgi:hypothetical protein